MEKHDTVLVLLVTDETPSRALMIENRKHHRWLPPGGHRKHDENIWETAVRETMEETGLDVSDILPKPVPIDETTSIIPLPNYLIEVSTPERGEQPAHYDTSYLYVGHVPEPLETTMAESELSAIGWLTLSQMDDMSIPADIRYMVEREMTR